MFERYLVCVVILCSFRTVSTVVSTLADLDNEVLDITDKYYEITSVIPLQTVGDVMNVSLDLNLLSISDVNANSGHLILSGYLTVSWIEERYTRITDDIWTQLSASSI